MMYNLVLVVALILVPTLILTLVHAHVYNMYLFKSHLFYSFLLFFYFLYLDPSWVNHRLIIFVDA